jgi:ketosteroid isomerase-like protein
MSSSLEIVQAWSDLLTKDDIEGAANLVADDIIMKTPKGTCEGKDQWKKDAPTDKKEGVKWEAFEQGDTNTQVVCNGSKKIGFLSITVKRTIELNESGKIVSIVLKKK